MIDLKISPRIVGGVDAIEGQSPYQCSLQINKKHKCGCVIITSNWLLTAAHCITVDPNKIEILVGTIKLSSGGTRYKVKEAIKHNEFPILKHNTRNVFHDIAAIRVDGPIQFNNNIQPIKYSTEEVRAGENLQVSGWGLLRVIKFLFI